MGTDHVIYGTGLDEPFRLLKQGAVRTRLVQGGGLVAMALVLAGGILYSGQWILTLFVLFAISFGALAMNEARRFSRDLKTLLVLEGGIQFPMNLGRLGGSSFLARADIARIDLHAHPYGPLVEVFVRGTNPVPSVVIEKQFILDWPGFLAAIDQLGVTMDEPTVRSPERPFEGDFPNPYGVHRLRGQFLMAGLIIGLVVAVVLVSVQDRPVDFAIAVPAILLIVAYLVYVNRSVPLRFRRRDGRLSVRTLTGAREFDLGLAAVHVGGAGLTIQEGRGGMRQFDFVDPEQVRPLWAYSKRSPE